MHLQIKTFFGVLCVLSIFAFHATAYTLKTHEIYDLEFTSTSTFEQEVALWTVFGRINPQAYSVCDGLFLLGGNGLIGPNTKFSRTYTSVPPHSRAYILARFWLLAPWTSDDKIIMEAYAGVSTSMAFFLDSGSWTYSLCGASLGMSAGFILETPSLYPTFRLDIYNENIGAIPTSQYGLRDIKITFFTAGASSGYGCNILHASDYGLWTEPTCNMLDNIADDLSTPCSNTCDTCTTTVPATDCLTCKDDFLFDGADCVSCNAQCKSCFGALSTECTSCHSGEYLYSNNTCQDKCETPNIVRLQDGIYYCDYPCQTTSGTTYYYYTKEKTCLSNCQSPYEIGQISPYPTCQPTSAFETVTDIQNAAGNVLSIGFLVTSAITMGNSGGVTVTILAKMLQYIKYLGINYPERLEVVLKTWDSSFISIEFMPTMSQETQRLFDPRTLPNVFSKWNMHSSFIVNFWEEGLSIATAVGVLVFFVILHRLSLKMKKKYFPSWLFKRLKIITQNLVLLLMYSNFDDIIFFGMLELRSSDSSTFMSTYPPLSFTTSICFIVFAFAILGIHLRLLILKERDKKKELLFKERAKTPPPSKEYEGAEILFKDFKHQSFSQTAFLFFFTLRQMAFYFVLTTLFEHSLAETIIIMLLNLAMLVYLFVKKPFRHILDFLEQAFCELTLLSINISVLTMATLDALGEEGVTIKDRMSTMIMAVSFIFNFAIVLFWGAKIAREIKAFVKTRKNKRKIALQTQSLPASLRFKLFHVESDSQMPDDKSQGSQIKSQSLDDSSLRNSMTRLSPQKISPIDKSKFYSSAIANVPGELPLLNKIKGLFQSSSKDSVEMNQILDDKSITKLSKFESSIQRSPRSPRRTLKLITASKRGSLEFDEIISQASPSSKTAKVINFEENSSGEKGEKGPNTTDSFLLSKDLLQSKINRRRTTIHNKGLLSLNPRTSVDSEKLNEMLQHRDSIELDSQPSPPKVELDAHFSKSVIPSNNNNSTRAATNVDVNSKTDTQQIAAESPSLAQQERNSWGRKKRTAGSLVRSPLGILSISKINSDKETIEIDSLQSSPKIILQKNMSTNSNSFTPTLLKRASATNI